MKQKELIYGTRGSCVSPEVHKWLKKHKPEIFVSNEIEEDTRYMYAPPIMPLKSQ